ncbi:hypothetical protein GDO81_011849 [Engystomops pustulosus]|uniref:Uncharacterized protein n=1 Tax=Engystomops pustulosus TaxID=76066 RepID=A0AAV7BH84_ENGPU|nr:hypothetical protein GDO81_011849 [Engystomops pustulosus]
MRRILLQTLSPLARDLAEIKTDMKQIGHRLEQVENVQVTMLTFETGVSASLKVHYNLINDALARAEDLENTSRRQNVRIRGLTKLYQRWQKKLFGMLLGPDRASGVKIERIHRALRAKPRSDEPPRDIVCGFLSYMDAAAIL